MKSTIAKSRFDWCSCPDNSFMELDHSGQNVEKSPHKIPKEIGYGWFQAMHLPLNMVVRKSHIQFRHEVAGRLFPALTAVEQFTEPVLYVQSARKGRVILSDNRNGDECIIDQNNCAFHHIAFRDHATKLDTSENLEIVSLLIGDSVLVELLGNECVSTLFSGLQVTSIPALSIKKIPLHINVLLHSSIPDHLTGNIAKLYAQAKVLEYLCAISAYLGYASERQSPESEQQKKIRQIHNDLLQLEGKVPALNELAKQYDLPLRLLKEGFMKIYGKSLFSYISEVRLNEAHSTLSGTSVPMKIIAKNLGYSHVNHFISAFGKQFGYSPGSLRKKMR